MAGFAGSQRLDERRRRRWAVEQDGLPSSMMDLELDDAEDSSNVSATVEIPIADFVPTATWKHVAVGLLLAVVLAGIVQADAILPRWFAMDGNALRASQQRAVTVFSGLCLLAAAQLSLLIRCIRGRSRTDFDGRFRIWSWATAIFGTTGLAVLFDFGALLSQVSIPLPWRLGATLWQVPAIIVGTALLLGLRRELRDARPTFAMWHLSALFYALAIALDARMIPSIDSSLTTATAMLGHGMLLVTLFWHTRHVVHIDPEPATSVVPQFRVWIPRLRVPALRLPSVRGLLRRQKKNKTPTTAVVSPIETEEVAAVAEPVTAEPVAPPAQKPVQAEQAPKPRKTRKARVEPAHVEPQPSLVQPVPEPACEPAVTKDDAPLVTADELKGLSKKQRRQLRKQRREAQRNSAAK